MKLNIHLTPRNWARVKGGKRFQIRGNGYCYEGERHREEQQGYKDPPLPVAERTGGNEKKRSDKNDGEEGTEHESSGEAARRHEFLRL